MKGDPSQFFSASYSKRVMTEARDYLEALLSPTFGERWKEVAACKTTAETVRKLARAKTEAERTELLKLLEMQFPLEPIKLPKTG